MLLIDIEGSSLTAEDKDLLRDPRVSGVILFTKNFINKDQLKELTSAIHEVNDRLFISIDQEGGRVQRLMDGFTKLPSMRHWGQMYRENPDAARDGLKMISNTLVSELYDVGIDISLVPVLDIDHGVSWVIGERSFGNEHELVTELSEVLIDTLHSVQMPVTGKHFPGHGAVVLDSHEGLPVDDRSHEDIKNNDMQPFSTLISKLDAVMPAHIVYPNIDDQPAGFSSKWLQEILRNKLQFKGVIISDDLSMGGAAAAFGSYVTRARKALNAGCDLLCVCNNRAGVLEILAELSDYSDSEFDDAKLRIQHFRQVMRRQIQC